MRIFIITILIIFLCFFLITGCMQEQENITGENKLLEIIEKNKGIDTENKSDNVGELQEPSYLSLYEGLHVTGHPIEVDINTYRLEVVGAVESPLSLTFDEIKKMDLERRYVVLECPGFFVDEGYWTGVRVRDILEMAEVKRGATEVAFTSIDNSYTKKLPLEEVMQEGFLIAYEFNDKEFSEVHGYPLRIVAEGKPGSVWVKWLGKIEVYIDSN